MGNYKPQRLYFDCETEINEIACGFMPEPIIEAPGNYKDAAKIAEYIAEKTAAAKATALERAALDPDYGRILSIGYSYCGPIHVRIVGETYDGYTANEGDLIDAFWGHLFDCRGCCVGYNILSFDLPYLMRRSMALGVKVPMLPILARYRVEPVTDLMAILYNWGSEKYKGLKQVCKLYGIPNTCPDVDGSKVKDLDRETLRAYQESDVRLVMALFSKMNGIYFNL